MMKLEPPVIRSIMTSKMVNQPKHYTQYKYEPVLVLNDWFGKDSLLWNVGKYLSRYKEKGDPIEQLEKARWYLQLKMLQMKYPGIEDNELLKVMRDNLEWFDENIQKQIEENLLNGR